MKINKDYDIYFEMCPEEIDRISDTVSEVLSDYNVEKETFSGSGCL